MRAGDRVVTEPDKPHGRNSKRSGCVAEQRPIRSCTWAALVASLHNPATSEFCDGLFAAGKPEKLALVAWMRELLLILNSMCRNGALLARTS